MTTAATASSKWASQRSSLTYSPHQGGELVERRGADRHREREGRVAGRELQPQEVPEREVDRKGHQDGDAEEKRYEEKVRFR